MKKTLASFIFFVFAFAFAPSTCHAEEMDHFIIEVGSEKICYEWETDPLWELSYESLDSDIFTTEYASRWVEYRGAGVKCCYIVAHSVGQTVMMEHYGSRGGSYVKECAIVEVVPKGELPCNKTGHVWGEPDETYRAYCESKGTNVYYCKVCGLERKVEEIPELGHKWQLVALLKAPTCAAEGQGTYRCGCSATKTDTVPAVDHTWEKNYTIDISPSCTEPGQKSIHCKQCDVSRQDSIQSIPESGHKFGEYITTIQATETAEGTAVRTCSVCGKKESKTIAKLPPKPTSTPAPTPKLTATPTPTPGNVRGTVKLKTDKIRLQVKKSFSAKSLVTGMRPGDGIKSWKSSNPKVASVNKNGKVTGKKAGKTVVTVKLKSGASAKLNVTVQKPKVATEKISGVPKTLTINKGRTKTLKPVLAPLTSQDKVTYTSSDKKIATVSSKGKITARKKGTVKITVKAGKKKVVCTVKIK